MANKIGYAIEVETESTYDNAAVGITTGYMRFVTGRPTYTGTDTGSAVIPTGDNSVIKLTLTDNTESLSVAIQSGELFTPSNITTDGHVFKAANTVLAVGDRFSLTGVGDTTGDDLETAKGAATAEGDMYEVTNNTAASEAVTYVGKNLYYEDFITKGGMSNPSRRITEQILTTGGYGTLSGFNFEINNAFIAGTGTPIWSTLTTNSVNLGNKNIRVYAIIADNFYQIWGGVVDNNPQLEMTYKFVCKANFKAIHKDMPPSVFDKVNFPNAIDDIRDEAIPVCLGDIEYASSKNISGVSDWVDLVTNAGTPHDSAQAWDYTADDTTIQIDIFNFGTTFAENDFAGKYLFVRNGGGSPDTDRGIRIESNTATAAHITAMVLSEPIDGFVLATYGYNGSADNIDKWNFSIADFDTIGIVSNAKISSFKKDSSNANQAWSYSTEENDYENINYSVNGYSVENSDYDNRATTNIITTVINKDGDVEILFPITNSRIAVSEYHSTFTTSQDGGLITDFDRSTYIEVERPTYVPGAAEPPGMYCGIRAEMDYDINAADQDFDSLYFLSDIEITSDAAHGSTSEIFMTFLDQYGRGVKTQLMVYPETGTTADTDINLLPNEFYRNNTGGITGDTDSRFGLTESGSIIRDLFQIDSDVIAGIKSGAYSKTINFIVRIKTDYTIAPPDKIRVQIKQIGMLAVKALDVSGGNLYTRLSGELLADGTTPSNTVYKAFRRLLEDYDGIDASKIDYGNLATARDDWYIGRQIVKKDNNMKYLSELAIQSFVAIFQNRRGKIGLTAWKDRTDTEHTIDDSTIIKNGITRWKLTGVDRIFNSFNVLFSYNPGANKYFSQYLIKDVDTPGEGPNNKVEGDETLWDVCNAAYDIYKVIKEYHIELSFFNDRTRWYNTDDTGQVGAGIEGSAFRFIQEAVYQLTRQHRDVDCVLPLNTTTVLFELGDPSKFRDPIYTDSLTASTYLSGHIGLIEYDIANDQIKIGQILKPNDTIDDDYGLIVETGSASDTITEDGSQADTITEGA